MTVQGVVKLEFEVEPEPWLENIHPRVLIDTDPGYSHVWASKFGPDPIFGCHDIYFTVGANVATPRCTLPDFGIEWQPIWNPVVIDWWDASRPIMRDRFTTVAGWWMNDYEIYDGQSYGPKAEEIRKFIDLPRLVGDQLEIALETASDDSEIPFLESYGWIIESPDTVASRPNSYRDYIIDSVGEFSCAKGLYVGTKCGWFSDRSSC